MKELRFKKRLREVMKKMFLHRLPEKEFVCPLRL